MISYHKRLLPPGRFPPLFGISTLPELILQRAHYETVTKKFEVPAYRKIGIGMREQNALSLAAKRFLDYVFYRNYTKI